jgi:hypothetical protein
VSSCTITSGRASSIAARRLAASNTSSTAAVAPAARIASARSFERVVPVTW